MMPFDPEEEERGNQAVEEDGNQEQPETRTAIAPKVQVKPSQEEVDAHMLTHLLFRSWCPHCVRGKSTGKDAHARVLGRE